VEFGKLLIHQVYKYRNPSYLCLSTDRTLLFAVGENDAGTVASFQISRTLKGENELHFINEVSTNGAHPCHIDYINHFDDPSRGILGVANYSSGNFSIIEVSKISGILSTANVIWPTGPSPNPYNSNEGHAHYILFTINDGDINNASSQSFIVCDLGYDAVFTYNLIDGEKHYLSLAPCEVSPVPFADGAGPRHLAFSPIHDTAYVMCELNSTVCALSVVSGTRSLASIESPDTLAKFNALPPGNENKPAGADICVSRDGKWVFCSIRGSYNIITTFGADGPSGKELTVVCHTPSGGETPRNICLDPTGDFLLVANQDSSNVVVFKILHDTGHLLFKSSSVIPSPVCIKFM
jgi:6-phosphogluconolactonase